MTFVIALGGNGSAEVVTVVNVVRALFNYIYLRNTPCSAYKNNKINCYTCTFQIEVIVN